MLQVRLNRLFLLLKLIDSSVGRLCCRSSRPPLLPTCSVLQLTWVTNSKGLASIITIFNQNIEHETLYRGEVTSRTYKHSWHLVNSTIRACKRCTEHTQQLTIVYNKLHAYTAADNSIQQASRIHIVPSKVEGLSKWSRYTTKSTVTITILVQ